MTLGAALSGWGRLLADPRGRSGRRALLIGNLLPFLVLAFVTDRLDSATASSLFWLVVAWPLLVAGPWRRLHDMGRRGAWNLLFYGFDAVGFAFLLGEYVPAEGGWGALFDGVPPRTTDDALTASGLGGFSTLLIFLTIHLAWLYLIPGQRRANPYGPPRTT